MIVISCREDDFEADTEDGDSFVILVVKTLTALTYFKSVSHTTEAENMEAHNCKYYIIFIFSKKKSWLFFLSQSKQQ